MYEVIRLAIGTLVARVEVQHWNASGPEKMGSKGERDDRVFSIKQWSGHYVSYANWVKACQRCISLTMKLPGRAATRARRVHTIGTPLRSRIIAERGLDGASRVDHRGYAKIMQDDKTNCKKRWRGILQDDVKRISEPHGSCSFWFAEILMGRVSVAPEQYAKDPSLLHRKVAYSFNPPRPPRCCICSQFFLLPASR